MIQLSVVAIIALTSLYSIGSTRKQSEELKDASCSKMFQLWIKTTWKMRSIYSAFAVHVFDFATDLLVITQWYSAKNGNNKSIDHIDSRLMAWNSIGILIFYKIISTIAVYSTTTKTTTMTSHVNTNNEPILHLVVSGSSSPQTTSSIATPKTQNGNKQPVDHEEKEQKENKDDNKVGDQFASMRHEINEYFANKEKKLSLKGVNNSAIESTMRFKYIQSLEALFESTPQAVLQLVYLMSTSEFVVNDDGDNYSTTAMVIVISICQSIISMTNSMLSSDNAYMARDKFKDYKKRLPPSIKFLKHFLVRLSEISYRVGLFTLFWTVDGGQWFALLLYYLGVEMVFPLFVVITKCQDNYKAFELEVLFLTLNMVCTNTDIILALKFVTLYIIYK